MQISLSNWLARSASIALFLAVLSFPSQTRGFDFGAGFGDDDDDDDNDFGDGPALLMSTPMNGSTGVAVNSQVVFFFSAPMAADQSITWSANLDPAKFSYSWSFGMMLTCAYQGELPAGATITWTLNPAGAPAGFKDLLGNVLPTTTGRFTTAGSGGGDPNDPCDPSGGERVSGFMISRIAQFVQNSVNPPQPDPKQGAAIVISVTSPTENPVTAVTLTRPVGQPVTITRFPFLDSFLFSQSFATEAAMNEEFPTGTYTLNVTRQNGAIQATTLTLQSDNIPVPTLTNFSETQSLDPARDFTLRWQPFTGAGSQQAISLSIEDDEGMEFHAPDECVPVELANTATSIIVPKNTFSSGTVWDGSLAFLSAGSSNETIADLPGLATYGKMTRFILRTGGSSNPPPAPPQFSTFGLQPDRSFKLRFPAEATAVYTIEISTDLNTWSTLASPEPVQGVIDFNDPPSASVPTRFYRVKAQARP
jgi:hypothetical protein